VAHRPDGAGKAKEQVRPDAEAPPGRALGPAEKAPAANPVEPEPVAVKAKGKKGKGKKPAAPPVEQAAAPVAPAPPPAKTIAKKPPAPPKIYPPRDLARDLTDLARLLSEPYVMGHRRVPVARFKDGDEVLLRIAATGDRRLQKIAHDLREDLALRDLAQALYDRSPLSRDSQIRKQGLTVIAFVLSETGMDEAFKAVVGEDSEIWQ
jgi:hypothetical protein